MASSNYFQHCRLLDPIYFGDYPAIMRKTLGDRLPEFTRDEVALLGGSIDFVGVNHYSSRFISDGINPQSPLYIYPYRDRQVQLSGYIPSLSLFLRAIISVTPSQ